MARKVQRGLRINRSSRDVEGIVEKIRRGDWDEIDAEELKKLLRRLHSDSQAPSSRPARRRRNGATARRVLTKLFDVLVGHDVAASARDIIGKRFRSFRDFYARELQECALLSLQAERKARKENARLARQGGHFEAVTPLKVLTDTFGHVKEAKEIYAVGRKVLSQLGKTKPSPASVARALDRTVFTNLRV